MHPNKQRAQKGITFTYAGRQYRNGVFWPARHTDEAGEQVDVDKCNELCAKHNVALVHRDTFGYWMAPTGEGKTLPTYEHMVDAALQCTPVEINANKFREMLDILPPMGWSRGHVQEFFYMIEADIGSVRSLLVRVGPRESATYWMCKSIATGNIQDELAAIHHVGGNDA